jgi:hypothetical protein
VSASDNNPILERLQTHLHRLAVDIGARPGGSAANAEAAAYIHGVFERSGLVVETQEYACQAWDLEACHVTVDGQTVETIANPYSLDTRCRSTRAGDIVTGEPPDPGAPALAGHRAPMKQFRLSLPEATVEEAGEISGGKRFS